jgi:hypothetical protein
MPNYTKKPPQRVAFRLSRRSLRKRKATRRVEETLFLDCEATASSYNDRAPQPREHYTNGHLNGWPFIFSEESLKATAIEVDFFVAKVAS